VFVLGADSLLELGSWREPERLVEEFDLVAIDRPGQDLELLRERLAPFVRPRLVPLRIARGVVVGLDRLRPGRGGRVFLLRDEPIPVSSSDVRRMAARDGDLAGLVPSAVAGYIRRQGLYRREARR
jgi:nicotinate-nucleotide adenylyltransferase